MQRTATIAMFLLLLACQPCLGQEVNKVKEPEFNGEIFYLDSATGELKPLEKQAPIATARIKGLGFGGLKVTTAMEGERSPVRFKFGEVITLIVRVSNPREDPAGTIGMSDYISKDGKRIHVTSKVNKPFTFDVKVSRYGDSSLKIELRNVPVGEWAIGHNESKFNYCFSIDPMEQR